jgi:hypothetical protein
MKRSRRRAASWPGDGRQQHILMAAVAAADIDEEVRLAVAIQIGDGLDA